MRTMTVLSLLALIGAGCKTAQTESKPVATNVPQTDPAVVTITEEQGVLESESTEDVLVASDLVLETESSPLGEIGAVYFEFDSAELTEESQEILDRVAEWLVSHPQVAVRIEGHTDTRGTSEYNLALGERRAHAIERYLGLLGVRDDQMTTVSYGEELPVTAGEDETAYAQNRRGELITDEDPVVGALDE